ncbi:MAG: transcription antitermination protein NusB [Bacteroidetes bacterium]|nr:transcription antitermination protein NusB [Bacteroidota bacterium]
MISRRLVRIKTLQSLYAWQQTGENSTEKGRQFLAENLVKVYEIYLFLLEFPDAFNHYLESEIEVEKTKYYPDKLRIRDCQILSDNSCSRLLFNAAVSSGRKFITARWSDEAERFVALFEELRNTDFVRDHLVFDEHNLDQQKAFLETFYEYLHLTSESFHNLMEDIYSTWNDDEDAVFREIKRSIQSIKNTLEVQLPDKPKLQDEDVVFGLKLFENVCLNGTDFEQLISEVTDNWDPARIAILDMLAIKMAIAEYLYCPEVPVKVTINEYLDIIRDYSTPGSSRFLNGILDKLRKKLESTGRIQKSGRGLRES